MKKIGVGKIASVSGRYYAMDRDNNYDRVKLAYDALTKGEGQTAASGPEAIQQSYDKDETDEFVKPTVVMEKTVLRLQLLKITILLFSSTSARTVQERSPDASAMMISKGFDRGAKRIKTTFVCFYRL